MKKQFGFIGCGNMGGALAAAVAKTVGGENLAVCDDPMPEKAAALAQKCGAEVASVKEVAASCEYIFLGVKPQSIAAMFEVVSPILKARKDRYILVSMAAGTAIAALESLCKCDAPIIRIMPNMSASVGEGMILYTANARVTEAELAAFVSAMKQAGKLDRLPEDKIDAACALSGCGPAYVYLFAEAMADGGVECGLARDKANLYAAQTLLGAAKMLLETGKHPGELKDAVCSPGGTTIAGVHALEDGAFRAAVMDAVTAAYEKTLDLKKS